MNKITVLFPGGFKPLTGAHLELANRYAQDPQVDRVILLIGPKEREGITRDKTMENMAKIALINEMLTSPDPSVRLEGARAASEFLKKEKRSIFNWN